MERSHSPLFRASLGFRSFGFGFLSLLLGLFRLLAPYKGDTGGYECHSDAYSASLGNLGSLCETGLDFRDPLSSSSTAGMLATVSMLVVSSIFFFSFLDSF